MDLIDTRHAARILGFHISSVRRWLIDRKLPGRKVFGRWRASRTAVMALAEVNKAGVEVESVPELPNYEEWAKATLARLGVS